VDVTPLASWVLLAIGTLAVVFSVIGILAAPNPYQRLHYMGPAATAGVVTIVAAIVVRESVSQLGVKAILTGGFLFVMNPLLAHATARALRAHEHGQWQPKPEENIPVAGAEEPR
jgi:monovalent cation/proton antiporter MnhG/PhaG subunit